MKESEENMEYKGYRRNHATQVIHLDDTSYASVGMHTK